MKLLKTILRGLRYRNYRLFFFGHGVSLIGTWIQIIANSWLVYRLTHSVFLLGVVAFSSQIPTFLLAPFAGVLADRWNRHRVLLLTQGLSMLQAFILALLTLSGIIQVWHILVLSTLLGMINALDIPVRQSFIVEMVEKRSDLGNAIALNSLIVNGARLIGPAIAGILVATVGEGMCFLLNAISFVAVIIALCAMKIKPAKSLTFNGNILAGIREGYAYVSGSVPIRNILLFLALISLMGTSYAVLMPVFAKQVFKGDARTLGFLVGSTGLGAFIGAMYLASRRHGRNLEKIIFGSAVVFSAGLIAFSMSRLFWLSLIFLALTGFGMMVQMASSNTALQTLTDDDKRGRVMSFYAMAFMGMAPFGSLIAGSLAGVLGAPHALQIGGFICLAGSLIFSNKIAGMQKASEHLYLDCPLIPAIPSNEALSGASGNAPSKN
jgi:MFS family permease